MSNRQKQLEIFDILPMPCQCVNMELAVLVASHIRFTLTKRQTPVTFGTYMWVRRGRKLLQVWRAQDPNLFVQEPYIPHRFVKH